VAIQQSTIHQQNIVRIGLFGYGKMGRAIEEIALPHGCEIVWRIGSNNRSDAENPVFLRGADVAIEFSRPESAFENVMACLGAGVPVICGTTGWLDRLPQAQAFCHERHGALLWASNFSIGVNLFFALNRHLARLMNAYPQYQPAVTEIHHTQKLDVPSGTAITLTEDIVTALDRKTDWRLAPPPVGPQTVPVTALREGTVPGTHILRWNGPDDTITLTHEAHSRAGFAAGALLAARWINGRQGIFSMEDIIEGN